MQYYTTTQYITWRWQWMSRKFDRIKTEKYCPYQERQCLVVWLKSEQRFFFFWQPCPVSIVFFKNARGHTPYVQRQVPTCILLSVVVNSLFGLDCMCRGRRQPADEWWRHARNLPWATSSIGRVRAPCRMLFIKKYIDGSRAPDIRCSIRRSIRSSSEQLSFISVSESGETASTRL